MTLGVGAGWDGEGSLCAAGAGSGVRNIGGRIRGLLKGTVTAVARGDWETMAGVEGRG